MLLQRWTARPRSRRSSTRRPSLEMLESRLVPHAGHHDVITFLYVTDGRPAGCGEGSLPAFEPVLAGTPSAVPTGVPSPGARPLGSLAALNSLPGAAVSVYLDFDGHYEAAWGAYSGLSTPAFDQDHDPSSFSDAELAAIELIWRYVAEDFVPFNVNITTVMPASFANGVALRVVIGGDGAWAGGTYGGLSYINSFTSSIPNTAFVFAKNLGNGYARYVADASSHEAGHAFGLQHQSEYVGSARSAEYSSGPGDGRAPLMGNSYGATRSLWWYGPSTSASTYQDDLGVIGRSANGFGFRPDDHANAASGATPLAGSGGLVSGAGIINSAADMDYFSFTTGAGPVTLTVSVPAPVNNLDTRLELRDASGNVLAADASPGSFGASVSIWLGAGTYYLVVAGQGGHGDVGQYTVSGSLVASAAPSVPGSLNATSLSGSRIDLAWSDVTGETSYVVERSTDGARWSSAGTTAADVTTFQDAALTPGTAYSYRVRAQGPGGSSGYSNPAWAATLSVASPPAAPSNLTTTAVSKRRIDLSWSDNSGSEAGFILQRSKNGGRTWRSIAAVAADVRTFTDLRVKGGKKYFYRLHAHSAAGDSAFSNWALARTPGKGGRAAPLPGSRSAEAMTEAVAGGRGQSTGADLLPALLVDQVFARRPNARRGA